MKKYSRVLALAVSLLVLALGLGCAAVKHEAQAAEQAAADKAEARAEECAKEPEVKACAIKVFTDCYDRDPDAGASACVNPDTALGLSICFDSCMLKR